MNKINYKKRYWIFEITPYQNEGGINDLCKTTDSLEIAMGYLCPGIPVWDMEERVELKRSKLNNKLSILDVLREKMEDNPELSFTDILMKSSDTLDERADLLYMSDDELIELIKEAYNK